MICDIYLWFRFIRNNVTEPATNIIATFVVFSGAISVVNGLSLISIFIKVVIKSTTTQNKSCNGDDNAGDDNASDLNI